MTVKINFSKALANRSRLTSKLIKNISEQKSYSRPTFYQMHFLKKVQLVNPPPPPPTLGNGYWSAEKEEGHKHFALQFPFVS